MSSDAAIDAAEERAGLRNPGYEIFIGAVSVLSIAAHLPQNAGRISGARIAYGAMGPTPLRAKAVERVLEGRGLDAATIAAAKTAALEGTMPATDAIASEWYRREVLPVHLGRLLAGETS